MLTSSRRSRFTSFLLRGRPATDPVSRTPTLGGATTDRWSVGWGGDFGHVTPRTDTSCTRDTRAPGAAPVFTGAEAALMTKAQGGINKFQV